MQQYLPHLSAWGELAVEERERVIGRSKLDDLERDDAGGRKSHRSLNTIVEAEGTERDTMPFGRPGQGAFGTYFIGGRPGGQALHRP